MKARTREFIKSIFHRYYTVQKSGCWVWKSKKRGEWDYGRISVEGKRDWSHRWAYRIFKGDIERGAWVLHSCDVVGCVNPEHLRIGTAKDNTRDMYLRGRAGTIHGKFNPLFCQHGHRMTPGNTYHNNNKRRCRECMRMAQAHIRIARKMSTAL